jgi:hypothetical protein
MSGGGGGIHSVTGNTGNNHYNSARSNLITRRETARYRTSKNGEVLDDSARHGGAAQ